MILLLCNLAIELTLVPFSRQDSTVQARLGFIYAECKQRVISFWTLAMARA